MNIGRENNRSKYEAQLNTAMQAARLAGDVIIKRRNQCSISQKTNVADLVTEVDKDVERLIMEYIQKRFPSDLLIGEEESSQKVSNGPENNRFKFPSNKSIWCIDPIDGTTNFVHSYPFVNVSIGYCAANESMNYDSSAKQNILASKPVVGVIYNPFLNEMYHSEVGEGAYCNGTRIHVDASTHISNCLLVNNIGHTRKPNFIDESTSRIANWLHAGLRGFRSSGSAAQNMAHVAAGKVSCFYEHGYGGPWDVCAGIVLVTEAGGVVKDARTGGDFVLRDGKGSICCGNENIVMEVIRAARVPEVKI